MAISPARASTCPRCGGNFHCGVNGSGPCACAGVVLPAELAAELRSRYTACLCVACLSELSQHAVDEHKKAGAPCDAPARC